MSSEQPCPETVPIAIVGVGMRLPGGVSSPDDLVDFLTKKGDGVCDVPADRWNKDLHYYEDPSAPGKVYVKAGGFLEGDVFAFDPLPFGISPREAEVMDPQQRLLLEVPARP
ncbi:beta-ketoacyl synthase [Baffinella frigidus]|nr:beta-ketoacyl synthase [Cryptophyta sp. CCMP2293]